MIVCVSDLSACNSAAPCRYYNVIGLSIFCADFNNGRLTGSHKGNQYHAICQFAGGLFHNRAVMYFRRSPTKA